MLFDMLLGFFGRSCRILGAVGSGQHFFLKLPYSSCLFLARRINARALSACCHPPGRGVSTGKHHPQPATDPVAAGSRVRSECNVDSIVGLCQIVGCVVSLSAKKVLPGDETSATTSGSLSYVTDRARNIDRTFIGMGRRRGILHGAEISKSGTRQMDGFMA